jgi:dTDP-4-amino-4,6-dideoxygalactose transaminase
VHLQKAYADQSYGPGDFPVAEKACQELLSLPMYPELSPEQIQEVIDALAEELGRL